MKKIINGKIYNTETAIDLYSQSVYHNGTYSGSNDLCVTPRGALFVSYTSNGQDLHREEDLHAVSPAEARDWLNGRKISDEEIEALAKYNLLKDA